MCVYIHTCICIHIYIYIYIYIYARCGRRGGGGAGSGCPSGLLAPSARPAIKVQRFDLEEEAQAMGDLT